MDTTVDAGQDGSKQHKSRRRMARWLEWPALLVLALLLALFVKTFLLQAFVIPSDSMNDTIVRGDRVLVDKLSPWFGWTPHRGDVVVFRDPGDWLADEPVPDPSSLERGLAVVGLVPDPGSGT
ncbi:signal peptidase I [Streptacidiphilus monticola]